MNLPKFKDLPQQPKTRKANIIAMKKELGLVQQQIDISRSRGIKMKDILAFDSVEGSFLFEDERIRAR